jgi:hypothetical protein
MRFSMFAHPVVALIAGILILLVPRLLSYIVAFYLIITDNRHSRVGPMIAGARDLRRRKGIIFRSVFLSPLF